MSQRIIRYLELLVIFVLFPLVYAAGWISGPKFLALLAGLTYVLLIMAFSGNFPTEAFRLRLGTYRRTILWRFAIVTTLLTLYMAFFEPENFLILPRTHPRLWLAIMIFYPIFSALPQEIIYRTYFQFRFRLLFSNENMAMLINALLFGILHLIFHNPAAVMGGVLTGLFWYQTYRHTGSLWVVVLEHALYGNLMYTIGFGHYFYVPDF
ncbi:MAG: CPBP family intramembrane glutamic endopeptidase [Bacteroidales bacterium]